MDPNATLALILNTSALILAAEGATTDDAMALAEGIEALSVWVSRGDFLPRRWARGPAALAAASDAARIWVQTHEGADDHDERAMADARFLASLVQTLDQQAIAA